MADVEVVDRRRTLSRTSFDFLNYTGREALCEGPTRSAKSWSLLFKVDLTARNHPGSRQLVCRQTRKSLNESVLKDWRDEILWQGHPAISKTASRDHQDLYVYPVQGGKSEVYFCGLESMQDTASPILSTKWDRIYVIQAEEIKESAWETLTTRLSSFKTPYHQMVADCNPAAPSHWLNKRFQQKTKLGRRRFRFRHYDNPLFYTGLYPKGEWTKEGKEYTEGLRDTLTGVRYKRFYEGAWAAADGLVLDNWDPERHIIDADLEHTENYGWLLHPKAQTGGESQPVRLAYFTAGVDWGWHPDPGVISVWGYDSPRWHPKIRRYRVAEICKTRWQREEWGECAEDLAAKFGIRLFSADRSNPEAISYFNLRLSKRFGKGGKVQAVKCPPIGGGHRQDRDKGSQIDLMREGLGKIGGEHQRTYLLRDAFPEGLDDELRKQGRPTCFEEEIESWSFLRRQGADREDGVPDPKCDDHALDAARYDETLNFARGFGKEDQHVAQYAPDTWGHEIQKIKRSRERERTRRYSWQ